MNYYEKIVLTINKLNEKKIKLIIRLKSWQWVWLPTRVIFSMNELALAGKILPSYQYILNL